MSALNVTVSGPRAEAEVVLPDDVAVDDLLPALALSYAGAAADQTVILVPGRGPLGRGATLREAGVRSGGILNVFPLDDPVAARLHLVAEPAGDPVPEPQPLRLPRQRPERSTTLTGQWGWLSAHGGAGASCLAQVVGGLDLGQDPSGGGWVSAVVVARTHAAGLLAAQALAVAADDGGTAYLGLVTVADGPGRLPRPLGELRHLVAGGYGHDWHVPWIEAWRFGDPTTAVPGAVRRLAKALTRLTNQ